MESKYFDSFTLIVIFGGLGVVLVGLALRQVESMQKNIPIWLFTGLMGILVGGGVTMVAMHGVGYHWTKQAEPTAGSQQMPTMGGGGGGMGAMMGGGGGGMGGGGGGGSAGPPARRTLPALVGKIDLVLGGLHLKIDDERAAKLVDKIKNLDGADEMTEDDAKEHLDAINDLLTDQEKEMLASFSLPFGRPGGGAPGGGGAGGRGGAGGAAGIMNAGPPGGTGGGPGGGGRGGPGGGGGGQASDENPFKQEDNAKRLQSLLERFGAPPSETKSGDAKSEEKPKE